MVQRLPPSSHGCRRLRLPNTTGNQLALASAGQGVREAAAALAYNPSLIGDVITEEEIWACTTCRNCEDQCPVMNEHVDKIIDLRRYLGINRRENGCGCTASDDKYRAPRKSMGNEPKGKRKLA